MTNLKRQPWQRQIKYTAIHFSRSSKSVGIVLIACTLFSLFFCNLWMGDSYAQFWARTYMIFGHLPHSFTEWINEGLMALFFFMAGMEIKKELVAGELSHVKKALLPVCCAIGGVLMPAVLFALFNKGSVYMHGWAIPTATDIAFSIGILGLLGRRLVPDSLRVFLTALAIIDDLIAIFIVALFYGSSIYFFWLGAVMVVLCVLVYWFKRHAKINLLHYIMGLVLWYCMLRSGIHATLAGVAFALLIPVRSMPLIERALHIPVNFVVIPLFALANTCIPLPGDWGNVLQHSLFWGIALGLFLGKVMGILLIAYLLVRTGWATLPFHTSWYQLAGAGILAGIGFTMSIFISTLAYTEKEWQDISKIAVLSGSVLSMLCGYCWLRWQKRPL